LVPLHCHSAVGYGRSGDGTTATQVLQGTLILTNRLVQNGQIVVEDGTIVEVVEEARYAPTADFGPRYIAPGYLDLHVHGIGGADVFGGKASLQRMSDRFAAHGVTGWLSSTVTETLDLLQEATAAARDYMAEEHSGARLLGTHLEGPFLDIAHKGMQNPACIIPPDIGVTLDLLNAGGGTVRRMSLAPEQAGAEDVIRLLLDRGVFPSAAHTGATYEQMMHAVSLGVRQVTHCFNAMTGLHHRHPGVVGASMFSNDLYAELIADGVHIHPAVMSILIRVKGRERVMLVTDAMIATELPDGEYDLGAQHIFVHDGAARLADGALASSTLTMDAAVQNLMAMCGVSLVDAVYMASTTPAEAMGWSDRRGRIAPGLDADLVVLDANLCVLDTWIGGHRHEPQPLSVHL
jgi:N-acetylglucosamine-6-phosphate deacetylase